VTQFSFFVACPPVPALATCPNFFFSDPQLAACTVPLFSLHFPPDDSLGLIRLSRSRGNWSLGFIFLSRRGGRRQGPGTFRRFFLSGPGYPPSLSKPSPGCCHSRPGPLFRCRPLAVQAPFTAFLLFFPAPVPTSDLFSPRTRILIVRPPCFFPRFTVQSPFTAPPAESHRPRVADLTCQAQPVGAAPPERWLFFAVPVCASPLFRVPPQQTLASFLPSPLLGQS